MSQNFYFSFSVTNKLFTVNAIAIELYESVAPSGSVLTYGGNLKHSYGYFSPKPASAPTGAFFKSGSNLTCDTDSTSPLISSKNGDLLEAWFPNNGPIKSVDESGVALVNFEIPSFNIGDIKDKTPERFLTLKACVSTNAATASIKNFNKSSSSITDSSPSLINSNSYKFISYVSSSDSSFPQKDTTSGVLTKSIQDTTGGAAPLEKMAQISWHFPFNKDLNATSKAQIQLIIDGELE